jgi:ribonuclease BN (tRNA processing enzyme)
MILTLVGSGSLVPSPARSTPALALEEDGYQATVDGGSGTLRRQAELGLDFRRTETLFFTHVHPDHTLDLLHFLFASRYTPGFRRPRPARIVGPPGFGRYLDHLRDGIASWTDGGEAGFEVHEIADGEARREGPLTVRTARLEHSVADHGYRFTTARGASAVFTGDTGWCDALVDLAADADLLIAECSGDAAHPAPGHLTAPEAGRLAREAGVKQLVLSHLYPLPDDRIRIREAAEAYGGPVLLGSDGARFVV